MEWQGGWHRLAEGQAGWGRTARERSALPRTRLGQLVAVVTVLSIVVITPSAAHASTTMNASFSSAPTTQQPNRTAITISGNTASAGTLTAYVLSGQSTCVQPAPSDAETVDGSPAQVASGDFTQSFSIAPSSRGQYTLCAHLNAQDPNDSADLQQTFTVTGPQATVLVSIPQNPDSQKPVPVTVSGSTQLGAGLYVYLVTSDGGSFGCGPTPASNGDAPSLTGSGPTPIGPGSYSHQYSADAHKQQLYAICAYVDTSPTDDPYGSGGSGFFPQWNPQPSSYAPPPPTPSTAAPPGQSPTVVPRSQVDLPHNARLVGRILRCGGSRPGACRPLHGEISLLDSGHHLIATRRAYRGHFNFLVAAGSYTLEWQGRKMNVTAIANHRSRIDFIIRPASRGTRSG
jgi:hypothetical protein